MTSEHGGTVASEERDIDPGSETHLAIERALEAASLRAGDALSGASAMAVGDWEPSAVEAGDVGGGADGA